MIGTSAKLSFVVAILAALSACATPYQDMGFMGGVKASQIDATTLRVHASGNAFTDPEKTQNYVMLKAAQETQRLGYDLFLVVDSQDRVKTDYTALPGSTTSYTSGYVSDFGNLHATTNTYTSPGHIVSSEKPRSDIVIKLYKGPKPQNSPPTLYAASEVIQYLGPQVLGKDYVEPNPIAPAATGETMAQASAAAPSLSCYLGNERVPMQPTDCQKFGGTMR